MRLFFCEHAAYPLYVSPFIEEYVEGDSAKKSMSCFQVGHKATKPFLSEYLTAPVHSFLGRRTF